MKIRHKKRPARSVGVNLAWFMAATAMTQFSAAAPEAVWAKEPNTEDPFDRQGAGRPDRWGRDPDNPYRSDNHWQPTRHRLVAQLTDNDKPIAFEIPPQSLSSALNQFGEQAGVQLAYTTEDVQGVQTAGVSGRHTVEVALARLLADSGIQYRVTGIHSCPKQRMTLGHPTV